MSAGFDEEGNTHAERTGLDYAREVLEAGLNLLSEVKNDPRHYVDVAPVVHDALGRFMQAEQALKLKYL